MTLISRRYQNQDDFWKVHRLLVETYPLTPCDFNWEIRRWEGRAFHHEEPGWFDNWARERVQLWETEDGRLVGAVHPEGDGEAHLELHPDFRFIEAEMFEWAETHLAVPTEDGQHRQIEACVLEYDAPRRRLLEKRGYEKTEYGWVCRRMRFGNKPLPVDPIAAGYILRALRPGDASEHQRIADILNAGFNRTMHTAAEFRAFTQSPSFRYDLHLVAEAPDGSFVAHVGVTHDEANRRGIFEPVCTHPDHRRKGLARSLMVEGLHRLKALGATDMYVATGDAVAANELYEAMGFTEAYKGYVWRKML